MYLKRHMTQKIVYHSKVLSLKLLKSFQKNPLSFDMQIRLSDLILQSDGFTLAPGERWLASNRLWSVFCRFCSLLSRILDVTDDILAWLSSQQATFITLKYQLTIHNISYHCNFVQQLWIKHWSQSILKKK